MRIFNKFIFTQANSRRPLGDDDVERKTQAEVLLNAYSRELERRRLAAGAQGLLISGDGEAELHAYVSSHYIDIFVR